MRLGEFVIVIEGAPESLPEDDLNPEVVRILGLLLEQCSLKTAVVLTVKITGARRDSVYREALRISAVGQED